VLGSPAGRSLIQGDTLFSPNFVALLAVPLYNLGRL
jgi:hypothetical protein